MTLFQGYTEDEMWEAVRFYNSSPDGQWDELAAAAIEKLIELLKHGDREGTL